jgi:hypothetical protein
LAIKAAKAPTSPIIEFSHLNSKGKSLNRAIREIRAKKYISLLDPGFAIGESSAGPFTGAVTGLIGNLRFIDT